MAGRGAPDPSTVRRATFRVSFMQSAHLPPIVVTTLDHERLSRFIERRAKDLPAVTSFLEQELGRAELVDSRAVPRDVVTMNSRLTFRTAADGLTRTVTLVYPADADMIAGKLSILTPIGVALLGLRPGKAMPWEEPVGMLKTLVVQNVLYQPEAAGRYDL
jgi:regulator of nucleoside diphosphate kinase